MKHFNWPKVLIFYISMMYGGIWCWVIPVWSMKEWWKGALVGAGLATAFIVSMLAIEFYYKLKLKYGKPGNGDQERGNIPPEGTKG